MSTTPRIPCPIPACLTPNGHRTTLPIVGLGIIYALAGGIVWGLVPPLVKRGLVGSDVDAAVTIQQVAMVPFLVLVWIVGYDGAGLPVPLPAVVTFVVLGAVGAFFGRVFLLRAIDQVGASRAQSIKNASPLLTTVIGVTLLGETATAGTFGGVIAIVVGILITHVKTTATEPSAPLIGFVNAFLSFAFYSLGPILKRLGVLQGGDPIVGALITQITGLAIIFLAGKVLRIRIVFRGVPLASTVCFATSGVVHAIGTIFTFLAVVHAPAVIVGPIWNIQPLVTFALAHFTLKGIEIVRVQDGVGAGLIVGGVFLLAWV